MDMPSPFEAAEIAASAREFLHFIRAEAATVEDETSPALGLWNQVYGTTAFEVDATVRPDGSVDLGDLVERFQRHVDRKMAGASYVVWQLLLMLAEDLPVPASLNRVERSIPGMLGQP